MANKSLQHSSLTDNIFYRSMLAGNAAFEPESESDDYLEEVVLTSEAASITFSSLGTYATAGYKHLQIRAVHSYSSDDNTKMLVRLNGDTGANYAAHLLAGGGSSVSSGNEPNKAFIEGLTQEPSADSATMYSVTITDILDFASTDKNKTLRFFHGNKSTNRQRVSLHSGFLNNTAALTSIMFYNAGSGNFTVGTRFSLYGSKG